MLLPQHLHRLVLNMHPQRAIPRPAARVSTRYLACGVQHAYVYTCTTVRDITTCAIQELHKITEYSLTDCDKNGDQLLLILLFYLPDLDLVLVSLFSMTICIYFVNIRIE